MNFKTCKNLQNTNVSCRFVCCCAVQSVVQQLNLCVCCFNIATVFQIIQKYSCSFWMLPQYHFNFTSILMRHFVIILPFPTSKLFIHFESTKLWDFHAIFFFFYFIFAFFEIITWHFARCFQSFDTWFVLFESFAHDDCQIIFDILRQQPHLAKWIVVWAFIMRENASIWESLMVFIDVQP